MVVRSYEIFIICVFLHGIDIFASRRRNPQAERYVITRSLIEDLLALSIEIRLLKEVIVDLYIYRVYYKYVYESSDLLI
jgi:hypothetical protein